MKRLALLVVIGFLCSLFLFSLSFNGECSPQDECLEDDSGELDIEGVTGRVGQEVLIPVRMIQKFKRGAFEFEFTMTYDPAILEFSGSFDRGNFTMYSSSLLNVTPLVPGRLKVNGTAYNEGYQPLGVPDGAKGYLAWLKFKVLSGAQKDTCYALGLEELSGKLTFFSKTGGCFCISHCDGDLDEDGTITPSDALAAFKCYAESKTCPDCADINQDGSITPSDALCLFRKYLGLSSCYEWPSTYLLPKIPFKVERVSVPWGCIHDGFYIDNEGGMYYFTLDCDSSSGTFWEPGMPVPDGKLIGTIEPSLLSGKYSLVPSAANGILSSISFGSDKGLLVYSCYQLYSDKKEREIILKMAGDGTCSNQSGSAKALCSWLAELLPAQFPQW